MFSFFLFSVCGSLCADRQAHKQCLLRTLDVTYVRTYSTIYLEAAVHALAPFPGVEGCAVVFECVRET